MTDQPNTSEVQTESENPANQPIDWSQYFDWLTADNRPVSASQESNSNKPDETKGKDSGAGEKPTGSETKQPDATKDSTAQKTDGTGAQTTIDTRRLDSTPIKSEDVQLIDDRSTVTADFKAEKVIPPPGNHGDTSGVTRQQVYDDFMKAAYKDHDFYRAWDAANSYVQQFGKDHDLTVTGMKEWIYQEGKNASVKIDLHEYTTTGQVPPREVVAERIAKQLGFTDGDMYLYSAYLGKKDRYEAFYGFDGDYSDSAHKLMSHANPTGEVNVGELQYGAIQQAKDWLKKEHAVTNPELPKTLPFTPLTTGEKVVADIYNPPANFAGSLMKVSADMIQGIGLPAHLFTDRTFMDNAADSIRSHSELAAMNVYTVEEQNNVIRCLANLYGMGAGQALPFMVGGEVAKGAQWLGEGAEAVGLISNGLNVSEKVAATAYQILGAGMSAGQVYDYTLTLQARSQALSENPKLDQIALNKRIDEIKRGENIDKKIRDDMDTRALIAGTVASTTGIVHGEVVRTVTGEGLNLGQKMVMSALDTTLQDQEQKVIVAVATGDTSHLGDIDPITVIQGGIGAQLHHGYGKLTGVGENSRARGSETEAKDAGTQVTPVQTELVPANVTPTGSGERSSAPERGPVNLASTDNTHTSTDKTATQSRVSQETSTGPLQNKWDAIAGNVPVEPVKPFGRSNMALDHKQLADGNVLDRQPSSDTLRMPDNSKIVRDRAGTLTSFSPDGRVMSSEGTNGTKLTCEYGENKQLKGLTRISHDGSVEKTEVYKKVGDTWECTTTQTDSSKPNDQPVTRTAKLTTMGQPDTIRVDNEGIVHYETLRDGLKESMDGSKTLVEASGRETLLKADLPVEKNHLKSLVATNFPDKAQQDRFAHLMELYHDRTVYNERSPDEMAKTYHEVSRLLEAPDSTSALDRATRQKLAEQLLYLSAFPSETGQGAFPNCPFAAMQNRLLMREPSRVAQMVADVATTGQYVSADGTKVDLSSIRGSLTPDRESKTTLDSRFDPLRGNSDIKLDGQRTLVDQLVTQTITNLHMKENEHPPGRMKYELTGDGNKLVARPDKGAPIVIPATGAGVGVENYEHLYNQITGKDDSGFVLWNTEYAPAGQFTDLNSFRQLVTDAQAQGKMPLMLTIYGTKEPFRSEIFGPNGPSNPNDHALHELTIRSIDGDQVEVVNQWRRSNDHVLGKSLTIEQLFEATRPPAGDQSNNSPSASGNDSVRPKQNPLPDLEIVDSEGADAYKSRLGGQPFDRQKVFTSAEAADAHVQKVSPYSVFNTTGESNNCAAGLGAYYASLKEGKVVTVQSVYEGKAGKPTDADLKDVQSYLNKASGVDFAPLNPEDLSKLPEGHYAVTFNLGENGYLPAAERKKLDAAKENSLEARPDADKHIVYAYVSKDKHIYVYDPQSGKTYPPELIADMLKRHPGFLRAKFPAGSDIPNPDLPPDGGLSLTEPATPPEKPNPMKDQAQRNIDLLLSQKDRLRPNLTNDELTWWATTRWMNDPKFKGLSLDEFLQKAGLLK